MKDFVITEFVTAFVANDPAGRRAEFVDRRHACFILTQRGRIRFTHANGSVIADAAHSVFLPKGLTYTNECLESAESYVFNFQTLHAYAEPLQLRAITGQAAAEFYQRLHASDYSSALSSSLAIFEHLYALAGQLFGPAEVSVAKHQTVQQALDYMRRYADRAALTAGDVAQHCHISEIYLRKLFARELHTTPFKRLTEIRMAKAKLLIEEKRPLKEVAVSVGYADVFQFSRAYKRYFGYPPSRER